MQENFSFEYAVIRVVPRVERDEFINVGVVLYCQKKKYLAMKYLLDPARLQAFPKVPGLDELEPYLLAFRYICEGHADGGPIARLETGARFRWLTAQRSTIVQTSRVHPGLTPDPDKTLEELFGKMVL